MHNVANEIILIGSVLGALTAIFGTIAAILKYRDKRKEQERIQKEKNEKQDAAIEGIKSEQTLLCYAITACLDGLHQQGCNGEVTKALNKMSKYLNLQAHK